MKSFKCPKCGKTMKLKRRALAVEEWYCENCKIWIPKFEKRKT
jgi:ribosomal protein L37AE/L43A